MSAAPSDDGPGAAAAPTSPPGSLPMHQHPGPARGAWADSRPTHPRATVSLVLGIVGLTGVILVLPFVVSPLAWYYGAVARREARREEHRWAPSGAATAGAVMGAIGTVLLVGGALVLAGLAGLSTLVTGLDTGYGS